VRTGRLTFFSVGTAVENFGARECTCGVRTGRITFFSVGTAVENFGARGIGCPLPLFLRGMRDLLGANEVSGENRTFFLEGAMPRGEGEERIPGTESLRLTGVDETGGREIGLLLGT